jgi:hypothetical protein
MGTLLEAIGIVLETYFKLCLIGDSLRGAGRPTPIARWVGMPPPPPSVLHARKYTCIWYAVKPKPPHLHSSLCWPNQIGDPLVLGGIDHRLVLVLGWIVLWVDGADRPAVVCCR